MLILIKHSLVALKGLMVRFCLVSGLLLGTFVTLGQSVEEHFKDVVAPVLAGHCIKCHGGGEDLKGGLNMMNRRKLLEGGDSGPVVDLDNPDASLLLEMVSYRDADHEMPPKTGKLSPASIAALRRWIEEGLVMDPRAIEEALASSHSTGVVYDNSINEKTRNWWSFRPLSKVDPPEVEGGAWSDNPIDRYIFQRLDENGLRPNTPATRQEWIRRAYYDITGLPPSPEDVKAFQLDTSTKAYEKVVDHLLASSHYGEKWGRHWLDLVRYAETNGYERDNPKPDAWRYRDYVIRSLNDDKPYDRFVLEQIAGDELDQVTVDSIIATGFHRLGIWDDEPVDADQAFYDGLDDVLATTGQAFMGLTVGCARCHSHKIDPMPHEDYYRLLAFFQNTYNNIREGRFKKSPYTLNTTKIIASETEIRAHQEQRKALDDQIKVLQSRVNAHEKRILDTFSNAEKEDAKDGRTRQTMIEQKREEVLNVEELAEYLTARETLKQVKNQKLPELAKALSIKENGADVAATHVLLRGNAHSKGPEVQPGFPAILGFKDPEIPLPREDAQTSGRRRVLAEWLVRKDNPLTARVMANRMWQFHFGRGLSRSPSNFGQNGEQPTHPMLLDWLANSLMENDWSLKKLHKTIMLSQAYQMSSRGKDNALALDPENNFFWRFNMRRLTAEEIRDSILNIAGKLNLQMGGRSIYTPVPEEVLATASRPHAAWGVSSEDQQNRRSIYVYIKRSLHEPILKTFDMADTDSACAVRFTTTVPTQALTMLNSSFLNDQAEAFAQRLESEESTAEGQVARALHLATSREPSKDEISGGTTMLRELMDTLSLNKHQALQRFSLLVLNMNEFVYLD
ncbi:MAG: PSD1 and planctomycete cytochrome C domain-containing protein [Verrucomicrobiota bacterium]|nr:PSD1 and planctomycete cytochrome C domain-containing protein [Verrucomicrobiota bacterium]